MSNEHLNQHDEQAMDAMLSEVLGGAGPPDLSEQILRRHQGGVESPIVVEVQGQSRAARKKSSSARFVTAVAIATALAASVLMFFRLRDQSGDQSDPQPALIADSEIADGGVADGGTRPGEDVARVDNPDRSVAATDERNPAEQAVPRGRSLPKGIPLVIGEAGDQSLEANDHRPTKIQIPEVTGETEAITLVSSRVDQTWLEYWSAIGIEPTAEAAFPELAARLNGRLDVTISPEVLADAESLRAALRKTKIAEPIARQWLIDVTDGGLLRIDQEARQRLISAASEAFAGKRRLDVTLAEWFSGDSPESSDWYAALSASGRDTMVHRIASLSLNVDLRCTRCHDSKIEGSGRQEDYWAFTCFFENSVRRDRDGLWNTENIKSPGKPLFYELPDGRQRLVQASVPASWIASAAQPVEDIQQWSQAVVASPELARGVVNSLWKLIHERRLRGGVLDTIAAPHSESLVQMEAALADDLLQSNFDVARTLALIIHSPATRRSVPEVLKPENLLLASDDELSAARNLVGAFAGALPPSGKPSLNRRIDLAMQSAGGSIQSIPDGNAITAQTDGSGRAVASEKVRSRDVADGFPTDVDGLPVHWLSSVKGFDRRVGHLGYLAGRNQLPEKVLEAAEAMKKSPQISDELALHRVWWLLSR